MKKSNWLTVTIVFFTLLRIILMARLPIYALGNASGDDRLLVRYADSLLQGTWIQESYTSMTLVKGISFPLFLVFCKWAGIPYFVGLALLYVFSAALFVKAISPVVKVKSVLYGFYLFLLYSPVGFDTEITQRVYRMAIIVPTVLIVFACFFGLWFRRKLTIKRTFPWAVGAGISLSFFWYICENSVWIMPFVVAATASMVIHSIIYYREQLWHRIMFFLIPLCIMLILSTVYSTINYAHYGTFLINDRTQGSFAEFSGNILKIDSLTEEKETTTWVYKEALDTFGDISPDFRALKDEMYKYDTWLRNGEIMGDLYQWALRKAASDLGYYKSSTKAEELFRKLNNELEQAFEEGKLSKKEAIYFTSQAKGIEYKEIPDLLKEMVTNTITLLSYEYLEMDSYPEAWGTDEQIRLMETVTNTLAVYPPTYEYRVRGTLQAKSESDVLELYLVDNETQEEIAPININQNAFFASCASFEGAEYTLNLYVNGAFSTNLSAEDVIDNAVYSYKAYERIVENLDNIVGYLGSVEKVSNFIIKLYQKIAVIIALLAGIMFAVFVVGTVKELRMKEYELWNSFFPVLGLGATLLILIFGITLFTGWLTVLDGNNIRVKFYAAGAFPMIQILQFFSLYFGGKCLVKFFRRLRTQTKQV